MTSHPHLGRVWKVGSRWSLDGNEVSSVLDVFRRHRVVFVGKEQKRFSQVVERDLMLVSDGKTVAAMGRVLAPPRELVDLAIPFTPDELERFDLEPGVSACRIDFVELNDEDRESYRIGAFHEVHQDADGYRELYQRYQNEYVEGAGFEIRARSVTLARNEKSPADILWRPGVQYEIPVFQRAYSWGGEEIRRRLNDLLNACFGRLGGPVREPMFLGTMQVDWAESIGEDGFRIRYAVIDGQQRITTIVLLLKALELSHGGIPSETITSWPNDYRHRITTRVGDGEHQRYFEEGLQWDGHSPFAQPELNLYGRNLVTIRDLVDNAPELVEPGMRAEFAEYLLSRVHFVVIETRAGLSKTLQIFNAINTAGMDLNGGDVFKVRFYEYLRKQGHGEGIFNEIVALYDKIDRRNREMGRKVTDMERVLAIARHHVVTEAGLSASTRLVAGTTFFDRFFDTTFNLNRWDGFNEELCNAHQLEVGLFDTLIDLRFEWESLKFSPEGQAMDAFIWRSSRFPSYYDVIFLFMLRFNTTPEQKEAFTIAFSKLLLIHSLLYERITESRKWFLHEFLNRFQLAREDETADSILAHLADLCREQRSALIRTLETDPIFWIPTSKNIACRLVAMRDELERTEGEPITSDDLCTKLFETEVDIEHIEAFNHADPAERLRIQTGWGVDLNALGNLTILDRSINRSISNLPYAPNKRDAYRDSIFLTVRNFAGIHDTWDFDKAKARKSALAQSLADYLCGPDPTSPEPTPAPSVS